TANTASPGGSVTAVSAKPKLKVKPKTTPTSAPRSQAAAPSTQAAPPPTHAAAPSTPARTTPTPTASAAPAGCHPLTNGGNCYEPGEYCRKSDHGVSGVAGDGKAITCEY